MAASQLATKLQIKPGQQILLVQAPASFVTALEPLPAGTKLVATSADAADVVQLFVKNSAELAEFGPRALTAVKPGGMLWVAYPKGSSGVQTDLNRDAGWSLLMDAGWQPVRQVAIDEVWSAVRFKLTASADQDPLEAHFAGPKAPLRAIYEALAATIQTLGSDVEVGVRASYIAFRRNKQFAVVKMSARPPRVELGLRLADQVHDPRLVEPGKSFGAESATVKVVLERLEDLDDQVKNWLAAAYTLA